MLYFRQILSMLVSLYTVRVVLETLGVEDYGIYNVVAGVVVLFSFLNQAMANSTQRFLNFAMGQNDIEQARNVFNVGFYIAILTAVLVVILAETVGIWLFFTWLNIPAERQFAAFVVYQLSVITTVINIIRIQYHAVIIAYEKMSFFAWISIVENILKLVIVFLLTVSSFDRLIVYAVLVSIVGVIVFFAYKVYCNSRFEIANFRYCKDKELFRRLAGFSGWNLFGGFANVGKDHGINILINIFHGVTVNAAMGIATQINLAVYQFVSNFQTASNPQIIKSYAAKDYSYLNQLVFQTSKMSFCLLFFFVLPLYINMDFVLHIWLKNVPEYTVVFTRLILLSSLADAIVGPLWASINATGNIKKYQLIASGIVFANIPLSLVFLLAGFDPAWVLIVKTGLNFFILVWHIFFLSKLIIFHIMDFFLKVIIPISIIMAVSCFITVFLHSLFVGLAAFIISCIASTLCIACLVYCIGLNTQEKKLLQNWIKRKISKCEVK